MLSTAFCETVSPSIFYPEYGLNFDNETSPFDDQLVPYTKHKRNSVEDVDYDLSNRTKYVDYFFDYDGEERKVGTGSKAFSNRLTKRALEDVDVFGEINATEPHCTEVSGSFSFSNSGYLEEGSNLA